MVNQVVPDDKVLSTALEMARSIAVIDPMVIRRTKQQINETMEIAGMSRALERSLEIDLSLKVKAASTKRHFFARFVKVGYVAHWPGVIKGLAHDCKYKIP